MIPVKENYSYFTLCSAINCFKSDDEYFETDAIFNRSNQCSYRAQHRRYVVISGDVTNYMSS